MKKTVANFILISLIYLFLSTHAFASRVDEPESGAEVEQEDPIITALEDAYGHYSDTGSGIYGALRTILDGGGDWESADAILDRVSNMYQRLGSVGECIRELEDEGSSNIDQFRILFNNHADVEAAADENLPPVNPSYHFHGIERSFILTAPVLAPGDGSSEQDQDDWDIDGVLDFLFQQGDKKQKD